MIRRWLLSLLCLLSLLVFVQLSMASVTLSVNEAATRVLLHDEQVIISLAVENPLGHRVVSV